MKVVDRPIAECGMKEELCSIAGWRAGSYVDTGSEGGCGCRNPESPRFDVFGLARKSGVLR